MNRTLFATKAIQEARQRCFWDNPARIDFAVEHLLHLGDAVSMVRRSKYKSATTRTGVLDRHIGQQWGRVAMSCRLVQDHGHSSQERSPASLVAGASARDRPGFHGPRSLPLSPLRYPLRERRGVLTDNEEAFPAGNAEQEGRGPEIAVVDPRDPWAGRSPRLAPTANALAWPSSQGKSSMTSINWGSSTTKVCPAERRPPSSATLGCDAGTRAE